MSLPSCPRCGRRFAQGTKLCPHDRSLLQSNEPTEEDDELFKTMPEESVMDLSKTSAEGSLEKTSEEKAPPRFAELSKLYAQNTPATKLPPKPQPSKLQIKETPSKPTPLESPTARREPPKDPPLAAGQFIKEYQLQDKIGDGGMGEIWRAIHPQIQKQVAIKFLHQDLLQDRANIHRFTREARAVNQIQHKNLVDIFSFGELPSGRPYFVMEFISGQSLRARLQQGPLSAVEVLQVFEQLCAVMQAAHDKGVIHRDLKPDNIFLSSSTLEALIVKVVDFGVAKLANDEGYSTQTGALIGTLGYMSPEQVEQAKTVDPRADIYSLGCILFEVLTGHGPFEQIEGIASMVSLQMKEPPVASTLAPQQNIPAEVDKLIQRTLSRHAKERPASCQELYQLLQDAYIPDEENPATITDEDMKQAEVLKARQQLTAEKAAPPASNPPAMTLPPHPPTTRPIKALLLGALSALLVVATFLLVTKFL